MDTKLTIKEITGIQSVQYTYGDGLLHRNYSNVGTYTQLRTVRKDPTVILARAMLIAAIQAGSWNIECDEEVNEEMSLFMEHILKLRDVFLFNCVAYGRVDYGWIGFEKIFSLVDGKIVLSKLKPLLHDITTILVDPSGNFNGFRQGSLGYGTLGIGTGNTGVVYPLDIPLNKSMLVSFDVEAGNLYGTPLLEYIREIRDMWDEANDGARRYDLKLAGTHWVIKYPPGVGTVNGVETDNGVIAATLLSALESSGSIAVPTSTATVLQELINAQVADLYGWHVELLSDNGQKQSNFIDRLKYLDTQKVRGLGLPERAILEGQFGTKAEAGVHGDMAIMNFEQIDKSIASAVNDQIINQLVELNYGPEYVGKIRLVPQPLVDTQITYLRTLYEKLSDPSIDIETLRNKLDIPGLEESNIPEMKEEAVENE